MWLQKKIKVEAGCRRQQVALVCAVLHQKKKREREKKLWMKSWLWKWNQHGFCIMNWRWVGNKTLLFVSNVLVTPPGQLTLISYCRFLLNISLLFLSHYMIASWRDSDPVRYDYVCKLLTLQDHLDRSSVQTSLESGTAILGRGYYLIWCWCSITKLLNNKLLIQSTPF